MNLNSEHFRVLARPDLGAEGVGLFASRELALGEAIYPLDYWSRELMPIHVTNHSCEPSAMFNVEGMLVALRDIGKDEEITYHYLMHPTPASPWDFECHCQSKNCLGWISVNGSAPRS
ncbi:MAG TPA: SET domain-containing protein [Thermoanaerobaculia bacterium]